MKCPGCPNKNPFDCNDYRKAWGYCPVVHGNQMNAEDAKRKPPTVRVNSKPTVQPVFGGVRFTYDPPLSLPSFTVQVPVKPPCWHSYSDFGICKHCGHWKS